MFKKESMYGLSAGTVKSDHCREVAVRRGSTVCCCHGNGSLKGVSTLTKRDKFLFIRKYGLFSCTYVAALILENMFPVYKANLMRSVTLFF